MDPAIVEVDPSQPQQHAIQLRRMTQQLDVRAPEDDWTGVNSTAERRRLQNRLNARAFRRRQRLARQATQSISRRGNLAKPECPEVFLQFSYPAMASDPAHQKDAVGPRDQSSTLEVGQCGTLCNLDIDEAQKLIDTFEAWANMQASIGSPRTDLLLTLTRFNVFRALVSNTRAISFSMSWLRYDAVSAFNTDPSVSEALSAYPSSLRPSKLQFTVSHHPWLDLLPFPALRDNILRKGEDFDDGPLCHELIDFCHVSGDGGGTGLIVWGEPSDPRSWEATDGLLREWGWLFQGCWDLIKATNHWRVRRGAPELPVILATSCPDAGHTSVR